MLHLFEPRLDERLVRQDTPGVQQCIGLRVAPGMPVVLPAQESVVRRRISIPLLGFEQ